MTQIYNVTNGVVAEVTKRSFTSKAGKSMTAYGYRLADGRVVECGIRAAGLLSVGATLNATVQHEFGRYSITGYAPSASATEMPFAGAAPTTLGGGVSRPSSGPAPGGRVFPVDPRSGEMAIIRQNALTNAVKLIGDALVGHVLSGEGGLAEEVEARANLAIKTAYRLTAFSSGLLDKEALAQAVASVPSPDDVA